MEPAHQGRTIPRLRRRHLTLDALDRVLSRASTGATSQYTYQGSGDVLAKAVVGGTTTTYAHTPGGPLAQKVGNTKRYYLRDLHGDLVGWSDTNGGLQGTALYDPWGELLSGTGDMATMPANGAFRFQGDVTDSATGQVDMLTRMYEPTLGRFSSRDVLFGEPMSPVSLNQYLYGAVNPVTYTDPTGLRPECGDCSTRAEQEGLQVWADSQPTSSTTSEQTATPAVNQPAPDSIRPHVRAPNGCARRCGYYSEEWSAREEYVQNCLGDYYPTSAGIQQCEHWFELEQLNEELCQDGCWIVTTLAQGVSDTRSRLVADYVAQEENTRRAIDDFLHERHCLEGIDLCGPAFRLFQAVQCVQGGVYGAIVGSLLPAGGTAVGALAGCYLGIKSTPSPNFP